MEQIEEIIRKNLKDLPTISFAGCVFNKKSRTACFYFFSREAVGEEAERRIAETLKRETGLKFNFEARVSIPALSPEAVCKALKEYIKNNFYPIFCTQEEKDVEVDRVDEGSITCYVTIKDSLKSYANARNFSEKCKEYLLSRYLIPSNVIVRIDRGKSREEELADYLARENDYKVVRPLAVESKVQQHLFEQSSPTPSYLLDNTFVVFDVETTGMDGLIDKIVEIAAVKISGGVITEQFTTLINPLIPIPKEVQKVHGITDNMVKKSPRIESVIPDFLRFVDGVPLVAHNADFDSKFLRTAVQSAGLQVQFEYIDTLPLSRACVPSLSNYKLPTLADYFRTSVRPKHRALADAAATAEVFIELIKIKEAKNETNI